MTQYTTGPQKFTKKAVTIEAMQFTGRNATEISLWAGREFKHCAPPWTMEMDKDIPNEAYQIHIDTLEGSMTAIKMDWIIKGVKGEFYPCKPDIFEATYSEAQPSPPSLESPENSEFVKYLDEAKTCFIHSINIQEWNTEMRSVSESLIIAFDQARERILSQHRALTEVSGERDKLRNSELKAQRERDEARRLNDGLLNATKEITEKAVAWKQMADGLAGLCENISAYLPLFPKSLYPEENEYMDGVKEALSQFNQLKNDNA